MPHLFYLAKQPMGKPSQRASSSGVILTFQPAIIATSLLFPAFFISIIIF